MELTVSVYQRRRGRMVAWHTIGLGQLDRVEEAATPMKVRQRLVDSLRKRLDGMYPEQLRALEHVPGRRVQVVALEMTLATGGARRRVRGKFPLVVEPRSRGPAVEGPPLLRVYHPLDSGAWFVHDPDRDLLEEAAAFFRDRWAHLGDESLEELEAQPKDRLQLVSFRIDPKRLSAKLERDGSENALASLGAGPRRRGDGLLSELGQNQTMRALDGRLDPGMPRSPYREQLQQLLCGERKAPVLLVGPPGSGKSTLVRRLVHDLLEADDYPSHRNLDRVHRVWQIRGRRIIAGMSYLGQWEQRCVDLMEACQRRRAILWVDDIVAWGRIGESRESERSLATFFRGPLQRGELTMVAECSAEQYQQLQDDAGGFASTFTVLFVEPTDRSTTMRMLLHEARELETVHTVAFDPRAFRTIYELGGALAPATAYPGKALDLLRSLAAGEHVRSVDFRSVEAAIAKGLKIVAIKRYRELTRQGLRASKDAVDSFIVTGRWPDVEASEAPAAQPIAGSLSEETPPPAAEIGPREVVRLLARRTGMPEVLLAADQTLDPERVREAFASQIMGQDAAVAAARDLVVRLKSGLADAGRPYGVFLFTGPTGTGKTEMAKCIAEYLYGSGSRLLRVDMSEMSSPDAPARLIGDRWRPEGMLTSRVRAQPFCVVLLDEVEKASPAVLNLMLQLFDDGRLTDATGTMVDFSHTVVVMTSNLGAKSSPSLGFGDETAVDIRRDVESAVREFFPPELFNRIDRVVQFDPLSADAARRIARRELERLLDRRGLTERNVFVRFTPRVVDIVVREGFAARDGARSLKRWLEDNIGGRLAEEIAGRPAAEVRLMWLYQRDGGLRIYSEHLRESQACPRPGVERLEQMLDWGTERLRREVPVALKRAENLQKTGGLEHLADALDAALAGLLEGETADADTVYNVEQLRTELDAIVDVLRTQSEYDPRLAELDAERRGQLEGELVEAQDFGEVRKTIRRQPRGEVVHLRALDWRHLGPTLPIQGRDGFLQRLGELYFLERAVTSADDAGCHAVLLELTRISRSRGSTRFAEVEPGLLEWLADAYAYARGHLEDWAVVDESGSITTGRRCALQLPSARRRIVLRLFGPAVRTFYEGEAGTHVRESLSGGTEIVRVRVRDGDTAPEVHVRSLAQARDAFVQALEGGGPLPDNPDAVLPVVRRYRFDPARPPQPGIRRSAGETTPIEVEDYPLAHVSQTHVRSLADVLPTLWWLRVGLDLDLEHDPESKES